MLNSFYDNGARLNSLTPTFIIEPTKNTFGTWSEGVFAFNTVRPKSQ